MPLHLGCTYNIAIFLYCLGREEVHNELLHWVTLANPSDATMLTTGVGAPELKIGITFYVCWK